MREKPGSKSKTGVKKRQVQILSIGRKLAGRKTGSGRKIPVGDKEKGA